MRAALFRPGDRPLLNLALLGLTLCTTFASGFFVVEGSVPERLQQGLMFSLSLVLILGSHEMGHYLYARYHGVDTSLPYFIPFVPFPFGFGTLGAVIRIRSRIPTRNALVDIGAAGPLAGLAVALPLLVFGVAHSRLIDSPPVPSAFLGQSSGIHLARLLFEYVQHKLAGIPPAPEAVGQGAQLTFFGDNLFLLAIQRLVVGPLPPGKDLLMHPVMLAGWFGLLVTMLNLIPIGQLDGGHVTYALFGRHAERIGKLFSAALLALCLFWSVSWLVWWLLTSKLVGFKHPEVTEPAVPLTRGRLIVAALCLLALLCCMMPAPMQVVSP